MSLDDEKRAVVVQLEIKNDDPVVNQFNDIVFNQHYVKTSRVPFEYGALFSRLEDLREEGDYNCHYKVSSDELQSSLNPAKEMINTIVSMVKKKMR